jgi:hypothetical protein
MKKSPLLIAIASALFLLAGCSPSTTVFVNETHHGPFSPTDDDGQTRPILESDLFGLSPKNNTEMAADPNNAAPSAFALKPGSRILLVQSGRNVPDKDLIDAFSKDYTIVTTPGRTSFSHEIPLNKDLRLYAASAKCDTAVFVWSDTALPEQKGRWKGFKLWFRQFCLSSVSDDLYKYTRAIVFDIKTNAWVHVESQNLGEKVMVSSKAMEEASDDQVNEMTRKTYNDLVANIVKKCQ